ncbi:hypothetical protein L249_7847 [Ophiocordyceps polyrhachis-furcata BCC 54312]|uniref:Uncharacterized protein n=1 Tax=Ophiocordyceps polyrhachis-furcata BCC 54312 TaxID=1330021 RepID=A0A367L0T6_9HYPO|nr:hypothetical protein L249_7847 [Ophiocordyceps polyrhachis-furcata BCC 54312]
MSSDMLRCFFLNISSTAVRKRNETKRSETKLQFHTIQLSTSTMTVALEDGNTNQLVLPCMSSSHGRPPLVRETMTKLHNQTLRNAALGLLNDFDEAAMVKQLKATKDPTRREGYDPDSLVRWRVKHLPPLFLPARGGIFDLRRSTELGSLTWQRTPYRLPGSEKSKHHGCWYLHDILPHRCLRSQSTFETGSSLLISHPSNTLVTIVKMPVPALFPSTPTHGKTAVKRFLSDLVSTDLSP